MDYGYGLSVTVMDSDRVWRAYMAQLDSGRNGVALVAPGTAVCGSYGVVGETAGE